MKILLGFSFLAFESRNTIMTASWESLRFSLLQYFNPNKPLGLNHTLLDCDFKDSFRCYPNEALEFYSRNGLGETLFRQQFTEYKTLPSKLKFIQCEQLESKIELGVLISSSETYTDISVEYLNMFPDGVVFLTNESFRFYFASIFLICSYGGIGSLDYTLDNFLSSIAKIRHLDGGQDIFSVNQKTVVANFLQLIFRHSPVEYEIARVALEFSWHEYLSIE